MQETPSPPNIEIAHEKTYAVSGTFNAKYACNRIRLEEHKGKKSNRGDAEEQKKNPSPHPDETRMWSRYPNKQLLKYVMSAENEYLSMFWLIVTIPDMSTYARERQKALLRAYELP